MKFDRTDTIPAAAFLLLAMMSVNLQAADATMPAQGVLRCTWSQADHASGIYYAKATGTLQVMAENGGDHPLAVGGEIAFGMAGEKPADFKPVSVTPIQETMVGPQERVKLPLTVNFQAAGVYELRWVHADKSFTVIANAAGEQLQAIFAPRMSNTLPPPWVSLLTKPAAIVPGYLADFATQTSVSTFLLDERFAFDAKTNIGLGVGASLGLSVEQARALFAEVQAAKVSLILRVTVPVSDLQQGDTLKGFRQYIADALVRMGGTLKALAIVPDVGSAPELTAEQRTCFRDFYQAAAEEVRKFDKRIVLLGAGSAQQTRDLLLTSSAPGKPDTLAMDVDALAISDVIHQPALARQTPAEEKLPLWILPPPQRRRVDAGTPGGGVAEGAIAVPLPQPAVDRGVTAHLFGGAVLFQKVHPENPPYIATFQGDGFAVAAIAGFSANTPLDGMYPGLARTRTVVTPVAAGTAAAYPSVEIPDDTHSLRVVDAAGSPVDCRAGDMMEVPVANHFAYVLQTGSADDLSALLRPAAVNRLPVMEVIATIGAGNSADNAMKQSTITLWLTNIARDSIVGTLKIILPPAGDRKTPTTLAEHPFDALASGKAQELTLPIEGPVPAEPLIVEIATNHVVQRTAVVVTQRAHPATPVSPAAPLSP